MQLHAPAAGLLRHAAGHGAPVRTVQGDQLRGVTEEDTWTQDGPAASPPSEACYFLSGACPSMNRSL